MKIRPDGPERSVLVGMSYLIGTIIFIFLVWGMWAFTVAVTKPVGPRPNGALVDRQWQGRVNERLDRLERTVGLRGPDAGGRGLRAGENERDK